MKKLQKVVFGGVLVASLVLTSSSAWAIEQPTPTPGPVEQAPEEALPDSEATDFDEVNEEVATAPEESAEEEVVPDPQAPEVETEEEQPAVSPADETAVEEPAAEIGEALEVTPGAVPEAEALAAFEAGVQELETQAAVVGVSEKQYQAELYGLVNTYRVSQGRTKLKRAAELEKVAQAWTVYMADHNYFEHNPRVFQQIPDGWNRAGENIAMGYGSAQGAMGGWKASEGHNQNMLHETNTHMGMGVATASNGRMYFTQVFAWYGDTSYLNSGVPYEDVFAGDTHFKGIKWMYQKKYIAEAERYYPQNATTRGAMATMLMRMKTKGAGFKPSKKTVSTWPYADVTPSHTHYRGIAWMYENGYAAKAPKFNPERSMTRGAMATFLQRMEQKTYTPKPGLVLPYGDVSKKNTHYKGIAWMRQKGYAAKSTAFNPNGSTTRASMATFLHRIYK